MEIKEIELLVRKAKLGDSKAIESLFFAFTPYINLLVSKFHIRGYDKDDLVQESFIVLNNAINKYNCNNTFVSYVTRALKNNIIYLLRKSTSHDKTIMIDNLLEDSSNLELDVLNHIDLEHLSCSMKNLSELEVKIIKDYYFNDYTLMSISKQLDEKYITTAKRKDRAITKLRNYLK